MRWDRSKAIPAQALLVLLLRPLLLAAAAVDPRRVPLGVAKWVNGVKGQEDALQEGARDGHLDWHRDVPNCQIHRPGGFGKPRVLARLSGNHPLGASDAELRPRELQVLVGVSRLRFAPDLIGRNAVHGQPVGHNRGAVVASVP